MHKALQVAQHLQTQHILVDFDFIAEAAMLHDIGMINTDTPTLNCFGDSPYLQHGLMGKIILEHEGLPKHALVCERHIGVGLTAAEISSQKLPLPPRDMTPQTIEEQIICYADLYYSKNINSIEREKTPAEIKTMLRKFGCNKVAIFAEWLNKFEPS